MGAAVDGRQLHSSFVDDNVLIPSNISEHTEYWSNSTKDRSSTKCAKDGVFEERIVFLEFEAAFGYSHRDSLFNALCAGDTPGKFLRLIKGKNRKTTTIAQAPAGLNSPFELEIGVRQAAVAVLFNFAVADIMRRTVEPMSLMSLLRRLDVPWTS
ncbi:hypothetical protein RB195_010595 [Necator americanus]|uniref:Reverse transcriptase domain-containing protein n=1 Tax=Necator americanus TaxID=51031 RepID=A0ABR1CYP1_NECAM